MESDEESLQYDMESTDLGTESLASARESITSSMERDSYQAQQRQLHVDYILVAEFSIDKGPTMEHQYPTPISGDEQ